MGIESKAGSFGERPHQPGRTVSVTGLRAVLPIGRTGIYKLLASGELESVKVGRRRLILCDSVERLIERHRDGETGQ